MESNSSSSACPRILRRWSVKLGGGVQIVFDFHDGFGWFDDPEIDHGIDLTETFLW
jgi:hypothetical protein